MPKKKQKSVLGLAPLSAPTPPSTSGSLIAPGLPLGATRALTKDERRLTDEWHKQVLVIDAKAAKGILAESRLEEVRRHGFWCFKETVTYIAANSEVEGLSPDYQRYIDEFGNHLIHLSARHLSGIIEVVGAKIVEEIGRPLYPLPEPEKRRGFLARLLGL